MDTDMEPGGDVNTDTPGQTEPNSTFRFGDSGLEQTYASPEHEAAWAEYRAHPDVMIANSRYKGRLDQLKPLITALQALDLVRNQELNAAHIAFQQAAHTPMLALTRKLMELDTRHPDGVAEATRAADIVVPASRQTVPDAEVW
jgi:hypothetical protein